LPTIVNALVPIVFVVPAQSTSSGCSSDMIMSGRPSVAIEAQQVVAIMRSTVNRSSAISAVRSRPSKR
jgi:hypothetical protein